MNSILSLALNLSLAGAPALEDSASGRFAHLESESYRLQKEGMAAFHAAAPQLISEYEAIMSGTPGLPICVAATRAAADTYRMIGNTETSARYYELAIRQAIELIESEAQSASSVDRLATVASIAAKDAIYQYVRMGQDGEALELAETVVTRVPENAQKARIIDAFLLAPSPFEGPEENEIRLHAVRLFCQDGMQAGGAYGDAVMSRGLAFIRGAARFESARIECLEKAALDLRALAEQFQSDSIAEIELVLAEIDTHRR